jgi:glycopeptide antibiotics resistance protein
LKLLKSKWYVGILFMSYIALILFVSFVGVSISRIHNYYIDVSHNFTPFTTIGTYLLNFSSYNFDTWFYNTLGIILLFLPVGILLSLLLPKIAKVWSIIIVLLFDLIIETMQYITQLGVFDVDDIILSTFGGFLGILIFDLLIRNYSTNG